MSDIHDTNREQEILDSAVAQGGAYEILRKSLAVFVFEQRIIAKQEILFALVNGYYLVITFSSV